MASCPITSWQIDGDGGNGNSDRLFSWAPKSLWIVTAAIKLKDACFLEFKRHLLLGKKATNLASVLKSRDTTLPKVCIIKTMVFPIVMYRCESWAIKKAECQRIDAFELWCWTLDSLGL